MWRQELVFTVEANEWAQASTILSSQAKERFPQHFHLWTHPPRLEMVPLNSVNNQFWTITLQVLHHAQVEFRVARGNCLWLVPPGMGKKDYFSERFCIDNWLLQSYEVEVTHRVTFTVLMGNETLGDIVIGTFGKIVPRTVENFVTLASEGYQGKTYENSTFHRVIPSFMIQSGDITSKNGSGSISIYGQYFDDENFVVNHGEPGLVSMANAGKNTNGSQFFITLVPTPWLDGHHTVFGKVLEGLDLVHRIGSQPTNEQDQPLVEIKIIKSQVAVVNESVTLE